VGKGDVEKPAKGGGGNALVGKGGTSFLLERQRVGLTWGGTKGPRPYLPPFDHWEKKDKPKGGNAGGDGERDDLSRQPSDVLGGMNG